MERFIQAKDVPGINNAAIFYPEAEEVLVFSENLKVIHTFFSKFSPFPDFHFRTSNPRGTSGRTNSCGKSRNCGLSGEKGVRFVHGREKADSHGEGVPPPGEG